ncbi:type II secretion system protein [bacterium]|nr:type II secretion system protein [bacterium]
MKKGFTLIELLVTITIFSIVITGILGLFASVFKEQQRNLNLQYLLQNTSYISEYLSRVLRMARKDLAGDCISLKTNYENPDGDSSKIRFLNYQGKCQEFLLENNQIKVKKSKDQSSANLGESYSLTPSGLVVERLKFEISGESQEDNLQPKVTFNFKIKSQKAQPQTLNCQTTISQRGLDVKY